MPFQPGRTKTGGRQKGTLNKSTRIVRETIEAGLGKSIPARIIELFETADPETEIRMLMDLMPYCYPKLAAIEMSGDDDHKEATEEIKDLVAWLKRVKEIE